MGSTLSKKVDSFSNALAPLVWACAVTDIGRDHFAELSVPACDPTALSAVLFLSNPADPATLPTCFLWLILDIIPVDAIEIVDCGGWEKDEDGADGGIEFGSGMEEMEPEGIKFGSGLGSEGMEPEGVEPVS